MKKSSIVTMVIGVALIAASLAIVRLDGSTSLWDRFVAAGDVNYTAEEKELNVDGIKKVTTHLTNSGITVRPDAAPGKIKVDYFQTNTKRFEVEISGDSLNITEIVDRWQWQVFDFQSWQAGPVVIHVPADFVVDYDLRTENGRVELADMTTGRLDIYTSNGAVELMGKMKTGELTAETSNGRIWLDTVEAEFAHLKTSNGEINLGEVKAGVVGARTSNGKINFVRLDSGDITLTTSNGGITGLIVGREADFSKDLRTSIGEITVGDASFRDKMVSSQGSKTLTATTSNGAIWLNFTD
ncbi:hypothetical protein FACS189431_3030 [Alphaproteobacteria bacterium]|nr:hypothetical protein FACS189431_3030 [Alphaproteobacteria bacterium]